MMEAIDRFETYCSLIGTNRYLARSAILGARPVITAVKFIVYDTRNKALAAPPVDDALFDKYWHIAIGPGCNVNYLKQPRVSSLLTAYRAHM
jgi:hypothetical protein